MEKKLYGFVEENGNQEIGSTLFYSSLEELESENLDVEEGTVYVFELVDTGKVKVSTKVTFVSKKAK